MIFAQVLGHVCYKQASKYAAVYRCMCWHTRTHSPNKHTPPRADFSSSCSFLLGTLKLAHVSPCPSLPEPALVFAPPSVPFHAFLPPFHISPNVSEPELHRVSYQIFHHVTVNKVKCSTAFSSHLFFLQLLLRHSSRFLSPVNCMQPCCNTKPLLTTFFFFYTSV